MNVRAGSGGPLEGADAHRRIPASEPVIERDELEVRGLRECGEVVVGPQPDVALETARREPPHVRRHRRREPVQPHVVFDHRR